MSKRKLPAKEYDNRNRGVLFKNEDKVHADQPDYKGSLTDGDENEYWMSAWRKKSKDGMSYLSIAITAKDLVEASDDDDDDDDEEQDDLIVKRSARKTVKKSTTKKKKRDDLPF